MFTASCATFVIKPLQTTITGITLANVRSSGMYNNFQLYNVMTHYFFEEMYLIQVVRMLFKNIRCIFDRLNEILYKNMFDKCLC